jgi:acid stress-induced BolA-like protein IbaG/YrbA
VPSEYPSEETLRSISSRPAFARGECRAVLADAEGLWSDYGAIRLDGDRFTFVTGGWSGNDEIIDAMRSNQIFWHQCWESTHRGGKYVFELPKESKTSMRICIIESPYRARTEFELQRNLAYARALVRHVTLRGDSPQASHLLITQALDDTSPAERKKGIAAGLAALRVADVHAFGIDLGISPGMHAALEIARSAKGPLVEEISLPEWAEAMREPDQGLKPKLEALIARFAPKWHVHEAEKANV